MVEMLDVVVYSGVLLREYIFYKFVFGVLEYVLYDYLWGEKYKWDLILVCWVRLFFWLGRSWMFNFLWGFGVFNVFKEKKKYKLSICIDFSCFGIFLLSKCMVCCIKFGYIMVSGIIRNFFILILRIVDF